ncbi:unnamed protein product [Didymodactylos carnosus]|uniref:Uncharacterized protein n=1 Tax=Didymodactylos carnosus TaxID=1234261 RepID=A0A8S2IWE2_9BILA|nr:unnamed protein product [Didymodactylos carnosus]CAF3780859.1 unnamed protein product [Didymodactylos carnosus]
MSQYPQPKPSPLTRAKRTDLSSPDFNYSSESLSDEAHAPTPTINPLPNISADTKKNKEKKASVSESDEQSAAITTPTKKKELLLNYVNGVLSKYNKHHKSNDSPRGDSRVRIDPKQIKVGQDGRDYGSQSAFDHYYLNERTKIDENDFDADEEHRTTPIMHNLSNGQPEVTFDPDPVVEKRASKDQTYKQRVYLRQLQPPTPTPIEVQIQEVLIKSEVQLPPIHVRIAAREPRTPSPILIKSDPPRAPLSKPEQDVIFTKYVPGPKSTPQQIIIHRYPDMPPKPKPIIVEQWLPYKPAAKRIINRLLPRETLVSPPRPRNIIISYSKPHVIIELELIRLPVVTIDPHEYQQTTNLFDYRSIVNARSTSDDLRWRI